MHSRILLVIIASWIVAGSAQLQSSTNPPTPTTSAPSSTLAGAGNSTGTSGTISSGCQNVINAIGNDTSLVKCGLVIQLLTNPQTATSASAAASANPTGSTPASMASGIDSECKSLTPCNTTLVAQYLSQLATSCQAELTGSTVVPLVQEIYDYTYGWPAYVTAGCTKDGGGQYCLVDFTNTTMYPPSQAGGQSQGATTVGVQGIAFFGQQPTESQTQLCTTCNKQIFGIYKAWFGIAPAYALGNYSLSSFFAGEDQIFSAANSTCGAGFVSASNAPSSFTSQSSLGGNTSAGVGTNESNPASSMGIFSFVAFIVSTGLLGGSCLI